MQLNRLAAAVACVITLAGAGLASAGATAAFAAATTSSYSCNLSGIIPLTEAGALTLTMPHFGVLSRTVAVQITQPMLGYARISGRCRR